MFLKMHLPATQMDFNVTTAARDSSMRLSLVSRKNFARQSLQEQREEANLTELSHHESPPEPPAQLPAMRSCSRRFVETRRYPPKFVLAIPFAASQLLNFAPVVVENSLPRFNHSAKKNENQQQVPLLSAIEQHRTRKHTKEKVQVPSSLLATSSDSNKN